MLKREPEFFKPLPPPPICENDPANSPLESKLSFGPMKALRKSLTMRRRKAGPKASKDSQQAPGSETLRQEVIRRDIPTSLAALHSTMKTQLRRHVSSRVLRHKLNTLQDYSLPDRFHAAGNSDMLHKMNEKENVTCRGEEVASCSEGEAEASLKVEEVWVRRTTPPRQAAQNALRAMVEMNTPTRSPQTSTKSGQKFARKALAQKV